MTENGTTPSIRSARVLIIGLVAVIVVLGLALVALAIGRPAGPAEVAADVNVLANSSNECVQCHSRETPGIVEQYGHSSMAAAEGSCRLQHREPDTGQQSPY